MSLAKKRILIIGGSSGIGFAVAKLALQKGSQVIIASRSQEKLAKAYERLSPEVITHQIDIRNENMLKQFFDEIGDIDHLQLPGSEFKTGPIQEFPEKEAKDSFDSKFWGPYNVVKHAIPYMRANHDRSITFYSGGYSQRPATSGSAVAAAINSAVEGLGRALAAELAPIRVNTIAPGLTITDRFIKNYTPEQLQTLCDNFCKQLIIKRPAQPEEIAKTAIYIMDNPYVTGNTLFVDGGLTLR